MEHTELQLLLTALKNQDDKLDEIHQDVKANQAAFHAHALEDTRQFTQIKTIGSGVVLGITGLWEIIKLTWRHGE